MRVLLIFKGEPKRHHKDALRYQVELSCSSTSKEYWAVSYTHLDFYVEGDGDKIAAILEKAPTIHRVVDKAYDKMTEVKPLKVAMYQRYYNGNADEGWTRLILENTLFDYTTVMDKDILNGLDGFDVLILPSDSEGFIVEMCIRDRGSGAYCPRKGGRYRKTGGL